MLGESAIQGEHGGLDVTAPSDRRMGVLLQFELPVSTTPTPPPVESAKYRRFE